MKKIPGQPVQAAGVLLMTQRDGQPHFLLMRHPNRWDLPKGHLEPGESFRQAALRETEEETGFAAESIVLDSTFCHELNYSVTYRKYPGETFDKTVQYFLGHIVDPPELRLTEHESATWFRWNPPHQPIQSETIDGLIAAVHKHATEPRSSCFDFLRGDDGGARSQIKDAEL